MNIEKIKGEIKREESGAKKIKNIFTTSDIIKCNEIIEKEFYDCLLEAQSAMKKFHGMSSIKFLKERD